MYYSIKLECHFIKERILDKMIETVYVKFEVQLADLSQNPVVVLGRGTFVTSCMFILQLDENVSGIWLRAC